MIVTRVHRSERGVSLAEVLVALVILAFVGMAVIAGILTSVKSNETSRTHISAESLARSELEYVNSQTYTALLPLPWEYTLPAGPYPAWDPAHNSLPPDYAGYSVRVFSVERAAGIQMITAVVRYNGRDVLTIETYRAQY